MIEAYQVFINSKAKISEKKEGHDTGLKNAAVLTMVLVTKVIMTFDITNSVKGITFDDMAWSLYKIIYHMKSF